MAAAPRPLSFPVRRAVGLSRVPGGVEGRVERWQGWGEPSGDAIPHSLSGSESSPRVKMLRVL